MIALRKIVTYCLYVRAIAACFKPGIALTR